MILDADKCNPTGKLLKVVIFRDKKDERRFLDPNTTMRVSNNIIKRAKVYDYKGGERP